MTRLGRLGSSGSAPGMGMTSLLDYTRHRGTLLAACPPSAPFPIQITGYADQNYGGAPESFGRPGKNRVQRPRSSDQHIDSRQPGISCAAVRARDVRSLPAEDKQANHSERVRQHHAIDDVGIKLVIATAQRQNCRPDSQADQAKRGGAPGGM